MGLSWMCTSSPSSLTPDYQIPIIADQAPWQQRLDRGVHRPSSVVYVNHARPDGLIEGPEPTQWGPPTCGIDDDD